MSLRLLDVRSLSFLPVKWAWWWWCCVLSRLLRVKCKVLCKYHYCLQRGRCLPLWRTRLPREMEKISYSGLCGINHKTTNRIWQKHCAWLVCSKGPVGLWLEQKDEDHFRSSFQIPAPRNSPSAYLISHCKCLTLDSITHATFRDQRFSGADPTPAGSALGLRHVLIKITTCMNEWPYLGGLLEPSLRLGRKPFVGLLLGFRTKVGGATPSAGPVGKVKWT